MLDLVGKIVLPFGFSIDILAIVATLATVASNGGNTDGNLWCLANVFHIALAPFAIVLFMKPAIGPNPLYAFLTLLTIATVGDLVTFGVRINMNASCRNETSEIGCDDYLAVNDSLLFFNGLFVLADILYFASLVLLWKEVRPRVLSRFPANASEESATKDPHGHPKPAEAPAALPTAHCSKPHGAGVRRNPAPIF